MTDTRTPTRTATTTGTNTTTTIRTAGRRGSCTTCSFPHTHDSADSIDDAMEASTAGVAP